MRAERRDPFEPTDRPVQFYEYLVCLSSQLLLFAWEHTSIRGFWLGSFAAVALLVGMSLWKLLLPPRFSATRGAYIVVSAIAMVLLFSPT